MVRAKLEYTTRNIRGEGKVFCAYCGKEIRPDTEIDHYETCDYYHCDCEDALKEIDIHNAIRQKEKEIEELERSMPKIKYTIKVVKKEIVKIIE